MISRNLPNALAPTSLLLVGDTEFTRDRDGRLHTLVALSKQLEVWFSEFDQVIIAAHLRSGDPPPDHRALQSRNIEFIPLHRAGGAGIRAKAGVLWSMAGWVRVLIPLMRAATAVHLRAPCNVTLVGIPLARVLNPRRYAIYADNWEPLGVEPVTYRAQRTMLRHFGGVVHGYAPPSATLPSHVRPNMSPVFTSDELDALSDRVERKIERMPDDPVAGRPTRICCIGALSPRKNQASLIQAMAILMRSGFKVELRIAGEGPSESELRALAEELRVAERVEFCGQLGREAVEELYEWADLNALVSLAEGFGKVFLEGMAFGCPAICGPGPMPGSIVGDGLRGWQVDPAEPSGVASAIKQYGALTTDQQVRMAEACRAHVAHCTIEAFGEEIRHIVHDIWGLARPSERLAPNPDPPT